MAEQLLRAFRFQVLLHRSPAVRAGAPRSPGQPAGSPLGDGAFQEVSGLELEMELQDYYEGGRNDGVIRRAGRAKFQNLVLKRGMFRSAAGVLNRDLWGWIQGAVAGQRPIARHDGIVQVFDVGSEVVATWVFDRGLPARIRGPALNARTGEIAIEELHIAHEGLRLVDD